jgi:fumarate hydratase class II
MPREPGARSRVGEAKPILITALTPIIGYDLGAKIVKRAYAENRSSKEVAAEMSDLSPKHRSVFWL